MADRSSFDNASAQSWELIAQSAQSAGFLGTIVQLGVECGADVTVNLRVPGDDRYLSVSFGIAAPDEEDETDAS